MRILGLTPCFFPVCEELEGGGGIQGVSAVVVVVVGLGGTLECEGGDPRMGGGTPRMGWGTPWNGRWTP